MDVLASVADADSFLLTVLETPTVWGVAVVIGAFIYLWRKDISTPEKSASDSVLNGAVEHSTAVYTMSREALERSLACERRFNAMVDYTRLLRTEMLKAGLDLPEWPEDALD